MRSKTDLKSRLSLTHHANKVTVRHSEGPPFRRVTLTVTVRVSRVSVMVSVRDSVK